jgi:hypothetical protein
MPDFDTRGRKQTLYCETEKGFMQMVHALIMNRIWFDVDFPEMDMPEDQGTIHTFLKGEL